MECTPGSEILTEVLYYTYKEKALHKGLSPITNRTLGQYIQKLFHVRTVKRQFGKVTKHVHIGIKLASDSQVIPQSMSDVVFPTQYYSTSNENATVILMPT